MAKEYGDGIGETDPIDKHVGSRLRMLRILNGYSQKQLGDALGLTFQQIQKNERGTNKVSANRLHRLARFFGVTVEYFYDGMPSHIDGAGKTISRGYKSVSLDETSLTRLHLEINKGLNKIESVKVKKKFLKLIKELSKNPTNK